MRFRRRRSTRPPPGEYPPSFTHGWIQRTLPSASPAEARALIATMRSRGWTEAEVAERILPYMPRPATDEQRSAGESGVTVPRQVTTEWLDRSLGAMDGGQIRLVVEELERRGWPPAELALAVLPHLLPKLPAHDARAILAGLKELGMTEEEIARVTPALPPLT